VDRARAKAVDQNADILGSEAAMTASALLSSELRTKVRELGLILWLDAEGHYTSFVDHLDFPYPVLTLRGSHLELMLALEHHANLVHPEHVLVHLPGLNKETIKETPVYELYKAGKLYEKNLATLVREAAVGIARPEELEAFLRTPALSLAGADAWLASLQAQPTDKLSILLSSLGLDDVVFGLITEDGRLKPHLPAGGATVLAFLEKSLGLNAAWRTFRIGDGALSPDNVSVLLASWLMAVEFVTDLREAPATPELQPLAKLGPFGKECRRLATRFRELHPGDYEDAANDLQDFLAQERTSHHAGALGSIDTFRFEEAATRAAAIGALQKSDWDGAATFASERTPERCFWVKRASGLQRTWEIIRLAASAGQALQQTANALARCGSLDEAVERYADKLAPVDRSHRLFEQRAHALLASDLDDYDALLEVRQAVRQAWRRWADALNRAFFELCVANGVLPSRSLRQRAVYEDIVHPMVQTGERVALFLVDAFRFEMAQGLAQELKRDRFGVTLTPRLAELPTDTAIGMNALAPVERNGRLRPVIKNGAIAGFASNEFSVCDPAGRVRAMTARSLTSGAADLELEEFNDLGLIQLKRRLLGKPNLVIVRSRELDSAGEHNLHLGTFDQTLRLLKSAISLLQQAGIERFIITADHGFLLQDASAESHPFGVSMRVPERRHALLKQPSGMSDVLEVRLSALEYDVDEDLYLVLRPDTALWQTREKIAPFAHGGNSLQERVIPLLVVSRQGAKGTTTSKYEVVANAEPTHLGRQRLKVAVRLQTRETASLGFASPKSITLALRVPGRPDIAISVLDAGPPAKLSEGRILLPPNKEAALVEFELEAALDEKVKVEIFHPDAVEDVTAKLVDGFFEVARNRRLGKAKTDGSVPPPASTPRPPAAAQAEDWAAAIADEGYRKAFRIIHQRRMINEEELEDLLGSARRVRAWGRQYEELLPLVPFGIEIASADGLKVWIRKD
jgi:hypothetical protein